MDTAVTTAMCASTDTSLSKDFQTAPNGGTQNRDRDSQESHQKIYRRKQPRRGVILIIKKRRTYLRDLVIGGPEVGHGRDDSHVGVHIFVEVQGLEAIACLFWGFVFFVVDIRVR